MLRRELGKISHVSFGHGGYQAAMIGVSFTLSGESWGVGDFWGTWSIEPSKGAKWTVESRNKILGEMVMRINQLLEDAKVDSLEKLKGVPVEVIFKGQELDSWRILKEVL